MGSRQIDSKQARTRGRVRERRRKRAERREATAGIREKVNKQRRDEGHPGWVEQPSTQTFWPREWGSSPYV